MPLLLPMCVGSVIHAHTLMGGNFTSYGSFSAEVKNEFLDKRICR